MKNLVLVVFMCLISLPAFAKGGEKISAKESVYDRVMRTGTIRCGYLIEPPFTIRDEATGKFSGLSVDLINKIAKPLNLKVEWKEQISGATFPEDLNNNKYDMVCGSVFVLPRGGKMDYTRAYAYVSAFGYVRADDTNFNKPFDEVDWSKVTISGLDGEGATTAAQTLIPEAKIKILPQLSNISEMLLMVATGKTDIAFVLPSVFEEFNRYNPGKLKKAELGKPIYTYDVAFGIPRGEEEFKALLNNSLRQLTVSGELEALFRKHDPNSFFEHPVISRK